MSLDLLQLDQDMGERNEDDEDDYDEDMLTTSHDTKFLDKGTKKLEVMFKDVQNELQVYTNMEKRVYTCMNIYILNVN
jgi:hypothetical protein